MFVFRFFRFCHFWVLLVLLSCVFSVSPVFSIFKSAFIVIKDDKLIGIKQLSISSGEAVIWSNSTLKQPVQITITNYNYDLSPHPLCVGFRKVGDCLITERFVPPGGIASYFFGKAGCYEYEVSGFGGKVLKGSVTVK